VNTLIGASSDPHHRFAASSTSGVKERGQSLPNLAQLDSWQKVMSL
jgi:hypothetical protein